MGNKKTPRPGVIQIEANATKLRREDPKTYQENERQNPDEPPIKKKKAKVNMKPPQSKVAQQWL